MRSKSSLNKKREEFKLDFWLIVPLFLLLALGGVTVFTSSSYLAESQGASFGSYHFFLKHLLRLFLGISLLLICAVLPSYQLRIFSRSLFLLSLLFLLLVVISGHISHGAKRWIHLLGGISFQPAEFARFSLVIYLADYLTRQGSKIKRFTSGYLFPLLVVFFVASLILLQPSLSVAVLTFLVGVFILFYAGVKWSHLLLTFILGAFLFGVGITQFPHAKSRIERFLSQEGNYQVHQAKIGIAEGKLLGVGLGKGKEKFLYLPEPHTDFIFAVIGEELGFIGSTIVIFLYLVFTLRGFHLAQILKNDPFASYLAFGFSFMLILYVLVNISVVLGIFPTTGIPLPFISYGGSALLFNLAASGILIRLACESTKIKKGKAYR